MYSTELNHTKSDLRNLLNRQCLVYCLYALGDSKYILLNRDYKPLGYTGDYMAWVDYDDYPQLTLPPLPPELMGRLKVNACGTVYLFDDNSSPLLTTAPVRAVRQYYWNVAFLSHFIASSVAAKKEQFTHCVSGDKRSVQCELDRCCLVYLLKEVGDSKYILLNRRYKPLGHVGRSWVDYNDYPQLTLPSLPPEFTAGFTNYRDGMLWLFNDATSPLSPKAPVKVVRDYQRQLALLSEFIADSHTSTLQRARGPGVSHVRL